MKEDNYSKVYLDTWRPLNDNFIVRIPQSIVVAMTEVTVSIFFSPLAIRPRECAKT
jgi:hypothetical protein